MILLNILSVLCGIAFVAACFGAFHDLRISLLARKKFVELLASPEVAPSLRRLWDDVMRDGVATPAEVDQLVLALDELAKSLSPKDRQRILRGLRQRDLLGRARYIASIMNRAGVAEGRLPVPVA